MGAGGAHGNTAKRAYSGAPERWGGAGGRRGIVGPHGGKVRSADRPVVLGRPDDQPALFSRRRPAGGRQAAPDRWRPGGTATDRDLRPLDRPVDCSPNG